MSRVTLVGLDPDAKRGNVVSGSITLSATPNTITSIVVPQSAKGFRLYPNAAIIRFGMTSGSPETVTDVATTKLYSKIGGTLTQVITGNITYGSGNLLKVVVDGQNHSLYYNGSQVSTTQAVVNTTLGQGVCGFNALAGGSVGTITST